MDGCKTILSFWDGLLLGAILVLGSVILMANWLGITGHSGHLFIPSWDEEIHDRHMR